MELIYKVWSEDCGVYFSWGNYFNEQEAEKAFNFVKENKKHSKAIDSIHTEEQIIYDSFEEFLSNS